jgi:RNA polymerase sigma-70 factor (ECF subfamily)
MDWFYPLSVRRAREGTQVGQAPNRSTLPNPFTFEPVCLPVVTVTNRSADVGERGDLERLYRVRGARIWRAVFAYAGDREVASDSVAEAFCQALRRGAALRDPERWIWRAAFRIAAGELADRRRTSWIAPDEGYEMQEPARELMAALQRLPEKQRVAIVLRHMGGYPAGEIAALAGSTPAAVRVHLMRARRRLRQLLKEEDDA